MLRSSVYKLKINFEKSHDSYLADKISGREFLNFFGEYSTLTLGYSHPILRSEAFLRDVQRVAYLRIANCETFSDEGERFLQTFSNHPSMKPYKYFHFCCTGALAVESAIKVAMDQKGSKNPKVISLKESFHGINGYGGFVTDRFHPVSLRLEGLPEMGWPRVHNPKILYKGNQIDWKATEDGLDRFQTELQTCLNVVGEENIVALLVEPIQATAGDNYFPDAFFTFVREWCDRHHILLMFDEIQTGFGVTGKMWHHQHKNILPDIVAFGKKAQVCGIMWREHISKILECPARLEVTWNGDLIDMIRSTYILEAFEPYKILENVRAKGDQLLQELQKIDGLRNVRGQGLLVAFDLESQPHQSSFYQKAFQNSLLVNPTREVTIRLRPPLTVTEAEVDKALSIIRKSIG